MSYRCGLIGCGFFARNHAAAWLELDGVDLIAVCDRDADRARSFADRYRVAQWYTDASQMLGREDLEFVDIVTQPETHRALVELASSAGVHVICQKPMASTLEDAAAMVAACERAGVHFMVHENFRWQVPMRAVKEAAAEIGEIFFGRISFRSGHDVYAAQPYLSTADQFIVQDLGVHLLDLSRFFLGDVAALTAQLQHINPRISGEDVATLLLTHVSGAVSVVDLSYATTPERELFPQTLVTLEGEGGTVSLRADYELTITTDRGTRKLQAPPRRHSWSHAPGEVVQDSVMGIQRHWLECMVAGRAPETAGSDNLETLRLVFAAYESSRENRNIFIEPSGVPERKQKFQRHRG